MTIGKSKKGKNYMIELNGKYNSCKIFSNNIDSLDLIELCMEIEDKFGIYFEESEEQNIYGECSVNNIYENILHYIKPIS